MTEESTKRVHIGVIGSAGRQADASLLSAAAFRWMLDDFEQAVRQELQLDWAQVSLASGGAAFADHVAVVKALEHQVPLRLYLPCAWDSAATAFADTGVRDWRSNPGGTSNHYHRQFASKCGVPSLAQLGNALALPQTTVEVEKGFFERNSGLAVSVDVLVAYGFGEGVEPSTGGTLRTWRACTAPHKRKRTIPRQ